MATKVGREETRNRLKSPPNEEEVIKNIKSIIDEFSTNIINIGSARSQVRPQNFKIDASTTGGSERPKNITKEMPDHTVSCS